MKARNVVVCFKTISEFAPIMRNIGERLELNPGDKIFKQDEKDNSIYYIEEGTISVSFLSPSGLYKTVAICFPGTIIGESNLFYEHSSTTEGNVIKKSIVYRVNNTKLREIVNNNNYLLIDLFESVVAKLQQVTYQLGIISLESYSTRIAEVLLDWGTISVDITHEQLASIVGCSRITATRQLNKLQNMGIIKLKRNSIEIIDYPALQQFSISQAK